MKHLSLNFFFIFSLTFAPIFVSAATVTDSLPNAALEAVVWVGCGNRQGSGTVIHGEKGYILTDAHVAIDINTQTVPTNCTIGFMDPHTQQPRYYYQAIVDKYVFDETHNRDFAILQITDQVSADGLTRPFPFIKTNEFATVGQMIGVYGFSQGGSHLVSRTGTIQKFEHGFVETTAEISPGDSGGAGLDADYHLIGIPARIVTATSADNKTLSVTYELEDIRAVMIWLDTYGENQHDVYFTHADYQHYHQNAVFIQNSDLDCQYVARSPIESTVYCLMNNGDRLVFPNDATFLSWFPNFHGVAMVSARSIGEYPLARNVTFKPGTLVKSATSARVYVVVDNFGTMRWIPNEEKAKQLWGPSWASLIKDIPDEFWINYTIGQPLDS